jgi:hypothetical protein
MTGATETSGTSRAGGASETSGMTGTKLHEQDERDDRDAPHEQDK